MRNSYFEQIFEILETLRPAYVRKVLIYARTLLSIQQEQEEE